MPSVDNLPQRVEIIEVGPRDGLQQENTLISVTEKVALIEALAAAGLKRIQITSFVHPSAVPQMADAEEVCSRLVPQAGVRYSGLALNLKGIERAHQAGLQHIDISLSASDLHSRRNANRSLRGALAEFDDMFGRARRYGMTVRAGIQCAFGYLTAQDVALGTVLDLADHYLQLGVDELALADSSGVADPKQLTALLARVQPLVGDTPLILHLHDTRGMGLANVLAALQMGVHHFDTAFGGLGGCPFIDGASGNIATEDTAHMLTQMGIETGIDLPRLAAISQRFAQRLGRTSLPGKLYTFLAPQLGREPRSKVGQTVAEKILAEHAGHPVRPGEIVVVPVDGVMATDATAPLAIRAFEEMGGIAVWDPERVSLVLDHATPPPNERTANLHRLMREFHNRAGGHLYEVGEGICHQLIVENGHVHPGDLFVGADSHTPTYGALNAFAIGVGSTDLAAVLLTGKIWLRVPETIRIDLSGALPPGISAKDLILFLLGQLSISGATYKAVEFAGAAVELLTLASRMVLANMSAEMGAKAGLVDPAGLQLSYPFTPTFPDPDAVYSERYQFDVSGLRPQIAMPHQPDNVQPIDVALGQRIDQAFVGSCTNARLEDLRMAARILAGKRISPRVRLIIAPASRQVFNAALSDGTVQLLSDAGATFITPGCGPCVGTHQGIPADGEVVISSANRNFQGRMGNPRASIYLGSPAVVAAAALRGKITDPAEVLAEAGVAWEML
jgi:3-isopropylmalate/(R)-2-methylmalate dehydratase large subunit